MFRSLYSKLAAVLAGLFCLVGLCFVGVTVFSTGMYQQEVNQKLNARLAEQIVSAKILLENEKVNREALDEIFTMLMVVNPGIEVYLLDPEGRILAFSAPEGKVKRKRVDLAPIEKWLAGTSKTPILGDDPRSAEGTKVFTAAPIRENGRLAGYLYVILGGEVYDNVVQRIKGSYILRLSAWMILASLFFALVTGLILFALLTGRLKRLANVMEAFRKGQHLDTAWITSRTPLKNADEIDRLGSTFTQMAERIQDQMEELKSSDALRRELVANVSHDLRTPLATLQGYIETLLLKDDTFSPEERRNYLNIAIRHCERLSKLVGELIELAKLESLEVSVKKEPFNLGELVQDVIQKFKLRAEEKQVSIESSKEEGLPFVHADIGLIERVLENLIENAVHYTHEGGSVSVTLRPVDDEISVLVSDTGVGIPEDELPHIFDRFYRLEDGPGHSGLGLAIAKRIIELHDRSLGVKSELNKGTTLSFMLPVFHNVR
jgi:two-component system OmpR family sensor kinase